MAGKAKKRVKPYGMTAPCESCPFRSDKPFPLRRERVLELSRSLVDGEFYCHKTVDYETWEEETNDGEDDPEYIPRGGEIHCAGALILLEKLERPSQMMRIAERIGLYDRTKLDMNAPVYDSWEAMLKGTAER